MASIRAGYLQLDVHFGAWQENAEAAERLAERAGGPELIVLPELAFTGYDFVDAAELNSMAEPFGDGPTSRWAERCARSWGAVIVVGYPEHTPAGCYNACLLATPDGGLHNYRKIHLFNRERSLFLPGDAPPQVIGTPAGRIGLMICFDWFFPELARSLALRGAQILAHPSNLVLPWCQSAMFARCVENRVYAVTANRIGTEERAGRSLTFTGGSQIVAPNGDVLASAPLDAEDAAAVDIDPAQADNKSVAGLNDLFQDRRPSLYPGIAEQSRV